MLRENDDSHRSKNSCRELYEKFSRPSDHEIHNSGINRLFARDNRPQRMSRI